MQWIIDNKEWIFSGAAFSIISLIATLFMKNKNSTSQTQKTGRKSKNYQAAGDINIGSRNDK